MDEHKKVGGIVPPTKSSIDDIIENMTANIQNSDGQYIQLGFTPPSTPSIQTQHHWSPQNYLPMPTHQLPPHQQMFLPEHLGGHPHNEQQQQPISSYLNNPVRSHSLGGLISGRDLSDGNFINYVPYGHPSHHQHPMQGLYVLPQQQQQTNDATNNTTGTQQQFLNNYVPFKNENDYGLFMNTPQQTTNPPIIGQERNNALIDNLVGNWSTGNGTYSPFGTGSTSLIDPTPHIQQQQHNIITPTQQIQPPTPKPQLQQQQQIISEERAIPKKRIVAEVRPMRPSYSDIVSKSPPTKPRTLSPNIAKMELNTGIKPIKITPKNNKVVSGKKISSGLKRQLSGDEPMIQKISMESVRSQSPAQSGYHRRVSLEEFDDSAQGEEDEERPDSAQDSSSQSGDNSAGKTMDSEKIHSARAESRGEGGIPLNNHKASKPGVAKRPLHINNNLNLPPRTSEKNIVKGGRQCKTCGEERRPGPSSGSSKSEGKGSKTRSNSQGRDKPSQHSSAGSRKGKNKKKDCPYSFSVIWPVIHQQLIQWSVVAMRAITWFLHLLSDVLGLSSRLSWHLCGAVYTKLRLWGGEAWVHIRAALPLPPSPQHQQQRGKSRHSRAGTSHTTSAPRWWAKWIPSWLPWAKKKPWEASANEPPTKLEANLPLPATGEEAMKRLLSCRGKDPYSILGVAPTCTDDDIKRYYKRQAFLVHPDKNSQPGAEEAFKILVHAFDLIGEPEKRQVYDSSVARSHQAEAAWSELSDLLAQLHQKMEEAANTIRCTNCGKRHKRVPVERPCYAARACAQCKIHHAAREGDIWAESLMLGFFWHYYACMEGAVYDITEWAACQADNLRHLRANSHAVQYRIVLGKKQQGSRAPTSRPPEQASEPDLEDFLNSLYGQSSTSGTGPRKEGDSPQRQADQARKRKGKRKK